MNLENWQTGLDSFDKFELDKFLEKSKNQRIQRIRNAFRREVVNFIDNWNTDSLSTNFDSSTNNNVRLSSSNSLNIISETIQDYFGSGNNYFVNEILDNYSVETQVQDFQHSDICGCSACCSNQIDTKSNFTQGEQYFETRSSFSTFGGTWSQPGGKGNPVNITYSYSNLFDGSIKGISNADMKTAIEEAFGLWSSYAPLNFTEVQDSSRNSQIRIGQEYIDGRSGTLAFAYAPTNGDIRFDNGENWNRSLFLETAVHEIGHSLGLNHENTNSAIMNPTIKNRFNGLGSGFLLQDDINGIRSIYGSGSGSVNPLGSTSPTPDPTPDPTPTPSNSGFDGTNGNDRIIGDNKANLIRGFAGDDYMEGGFGLDTIDGGAGNDTVSYSYSSSAFTWDMRTDRLSFNAGGSETIRNVENVIGSRGDDRIITNAVNNTIEGNDGADTFVFNSLDGSVDTIKDFNLGQGDRLEVSRAGFGSGGFSYDSSSGGLFFNNEEFAVLANKPTFSDVRSGFVVR